MLDLLEDFLTLRNIQYARLDGSTSRPRRALDIKLVSPSSGSLVGFCLLRVSFNKRILVSTVYRYSKLDSIFWASISSLLDLYESWRARYVYDPPSG